MRRIRPSSVWSVVTAVVAGLLPALLTASPAQAAEVYYRPADGVLHLSGHGYGHGHGLSQWGAYGAAIQGVTYDKILATYYPGTTWGSTSGKQIRVDLTADSKASSDGHYDLQVAPASGLTVTDANGAQLVVPTDSSYTRWRVMIALSDGSFHVQGLTSNGWTGDFKPTSPAGVTTWTSPVGFSASTPVTVYSPTGSAKAYRDRVELAATGPNATTAMTVNRLTLEHYLYGVVPSEMPSSWTPGGRLDGLKAQAVAARSYASWRMNYPQSGLFDIYDSTVDQAYEGYNHEAASTNQAVDQTAGKILLDANSRPIFAQYSSSDGGYTADGGQPYLTAHADPWDGVPTESWNPHSWSTTITAAQIQAAYPSIGGFASLAVNSREGYSGEQWGGRIKSLTLNGSRGSVTVTGAAFRAAMALRSEWFVVVVSKPTAPTSVRASAGDASATVLWGAPTSDGGGGITSYTITASPAIPPVSVGGSARSATITGLTNERSYTFTVTATNTAGTGPGTAAPAVTPTATGEFHPLPPTRILDTRKTNTPLGWGKTMALRVMGVGGVPGSGVTSVVINVTADHSTTSSHLTVYPHYQPRPTASQLSWAQGVTTAELVLAKPGRGGNVDIWNYSGSVHLIVDVEGYYTNDGSAGGTRLTTVTPARLIDTRTGSAPTKIGPRGTRVVTVAGKGGVPTSATAVVVNVTALRPTTSTYLTVWPSGQSRPLASAVNVPKGVVMANEVLVPLGSDGNIVVGNNGGAIDVVVDVQGYFTAPADPTSTSGRVAAVAPLRVLDTRTTNGGHKAPLKPGETISLKVVGRASNIPSSNVSAVVLSVTATRESGGGPITLWPAGQSMPLASNLNPRPRLDIGALVTVAPGPGGAVQIHNGTTGTLDVVADLVGWATA